jgi:ribosome modulation factor
MSHDLKSLIGPVVHMEVVAWYQGYEARYASRGKGANPYASHVFGPEWLNGWQLADEELRVNGTYLIR